MKKILSVQTNAEQHWVGDGFPVRTLFSYQTHAQLLSPFLLLDYAGPAHFPPSDQPKGVGQHPHRGFETVTIVYQGEVSHRDSTGKGGTIGPGDVQWMTAGAGILHDEFHSAPFTRDGGTLEMVQLWVNLPTRDKLAAPGYQAITQAEIPAISLPHNAGELRVIAGRYGDHCGPARTFSPLQVWDLKCHAKSTIELPLAEGWNTALIVLRGQITINNEQNAQDGQLVVLSAQGQGASIQAQTQATLLLLSGEPLNEPVVGHGPFVMNTRTEIETAIDDFNQGRFGKIDTAV